MSKNTNPYTVDATIVGPIYKRLLAENGLIDVPYNLDSPGFRKRSQLWRIAFAEAKAIEQAQEELDNLPTPEFDRFDICEAYYLLESDYNESGLLQERPSNQRRSMSTGVQLHRMQFRASPLLTYDTLTENGQTIYKTNEIAILKRMFGLTK